MVDSNVTTIVEGAVFNFPPLAACGVYRVFVHVPT